MEEFIVKNKIFVDSVFVIFEKSSYYIIHFIQSTGLGVFFLLLGAIFIFDTQGAFLLKYGFWYWLLI